MDGSDYWGGGLPKSHAKFNPSYIAKVKPDMRLFLSVQKFSNEHTNKQTHHRLSHIICTICMADVFFNTCVSVCGCHGEYTCDMERTILQLHALLHKKTCIRGKI